MSALRDSIILWANLLVLALFFVMIGIANEMPGVFEQRNGNGALIGAALGIGLAFVLLGARRRDGPPTGGASGALAGWQVGVHDAEMGHVLSKTVSASGSITNTGNLAAVYSVILAYIDEFEQGLDARTGITLSPGQSTSVSLSGTIGLENDQDIAINVRLHITSPISQDNVDVFNTGHTEAHPHTVSGSMSGWSASVSQHGRKGFVRRR